MALVYSRFEDIEDALFDVVRQFIDRPSAPGQPLLIWDKRNNPERPPPYAKLNLITKSIQNGNDTTKNVPQEILLQFDADVLTGQTIDGDIDGNAITPVPFDTSMDDTLRALSKELLTNVDVDNIEFMFAQRKLFIQMVKGKDLLFNNFAVTGGGALPNVTITEINDSTQFATIGQREMVLSINGYGIGTDDDLLRLQNAFETMEFQETMRQFNISRTGPQANITNIGDIVATAFEERSNLTVSFYFPVKIISGITFIETANVIGTYPDKQALTEYQNKLLTIGGAEMVCYYPLNELIGSLMIDLSGKMSDGAYVSTSLNSEDAPSGTRAPFLDGIASVGNLVASDFNTLFNQEEFTISVWMRRPTSPYIPGGLSLSLVKDNSSINNIELVHTFYSSANRLEWRLDMGGVPKLLSTANPTPLEDYKRITITMSKINNRIRYYLGNTLITTETPGTFTGTTWTQFTLCALDTGSGPSIFSIIHPSDLIIYNREATVGEVAQMVDAP